MCKRTGVKHNLIGRKCNLLFPVLVVSLQATTAVRISIH